MAGRENPDLGRYPGECALPLSMELPRVALHLGIVPSTGTAAVKSMQCLDCGDECHPKLRHPSSLRTEAMVWLVAVLLGLAAGAWRAVTSPAGSDLPAVSQLSVVRPAVEQAAIPAPDASGPRNIAVQVGGWLVDRLVQFLRVAWWALPIPILFSTWRQARKYAVCVHCGSRRLEPAADVWP